MSRMKNNKKLIMILAMLLLFIISLIYPERLAVNHVKPDLLLVFIIIAAVIFEDKTVIFLTIFTSLIRDLTEFGFPGPYFLLYAILAVLIYFLASFFYRPGVVVCLFFVAVFTFLHDILWIILFNAYYLLRFSIGTDFSFGQNISRGTIYHIPQNLAAGILIFYMMIYIRRRVLNERS